MTGFRVHLETSKPWISPELIAEANLDQIRRLIAGICVYPLLFVILAFSTAFQVEHPVLFWTSAGIILASAAMRMVLLRFGNSLAAQTQLLLKLLTLNVCMTSGVSGCVYLAALRFYGFESWPFAVTMEWLVGIASGSTISFTPTSTGRRPARFPAGRSKYRSERRAPKPESDAWVREPYWGCKPNSVDFTRLVISIN